MRRRGWSALGIIVLAVIIVVIVIVSKMSLSALPEPGRTETALATEAKDWFIGRAARGPLPPAPVNDASALTAGSALFGMDCASCHGQDGRTPAPIGKSMYPRVLNLGSPDVQSMADREIFWVIRNGIRFSGMPGFGRINSDQENWQLTYYVRSLGGKPQPQSPSVKR